MKMVRARLKRTYIYGNPGKAYGPGENVEVPEGLALSIGAKLIPEPEPPKPAPKPKPKPKKASGK